MILSFDYGLVCQAEETKEKIVNGQFEWKWSGWKRELGKLRPLRAKKLGCSRPEGEIDAIEIR